MNILLRLFSLKLGTTILGVIYSILQVRYFGASRQIEIYFAAQSLVYLVTSLTQGGQLAEIFLPEYHKLNVKREGLGYQGLNVVISRVLLYGSGLIVFVFIFAPFFIQLLVPGFSQVDKGQATLLFRVLLPYLCLQLMNSFFITVLNADKKFGRAELLGLTNTIVNIVSLILLYPYIGIWALVVSMLLGKAIEFSFYISQLYKNGYQFNFILSIPEFNHSSFFKAMKSTLLYVGATQIYSIVLTASISFLPEGTYAIFKYVQNLANKIKGLFVQPFLTIFFTNYSLLLQKSASVFNEFTKNLSSIINVNIVAIIGSILMGDLIIDLIWGGKNFDSQDVTLAYLFLLFNIFAVLLSSIGSVYRKMAVANGKAKELYLFWVIAQLFSAGFSYFLIKIFQTKGLLFIIPINAFLMGITSYFVYKKTNNAINYQSFNINSLISLALIIVAFFSKIFVNNYMEFNNKLLLVFVCSILVLILSIIPIYSTYKLIKETTSLSVE